MGLRAKFLYLLAGLVALFLIYIHLVVIPPVKERTLQLAEQAHRAQLGLVAEAVVPLLLENDLANIYELLDAIRHDSPSWLQVQLFSEQGQRLYPLVLSQLEPDRASTLVLETRVGFLEPAVGWLQVTVDMTATRQVTDELEHGLLIALVVLLVAMLIVVWVQMEIVILRPLAQMVGAAHKLMQGRFDVRLPESKQDEIGELAHTFVDLRNAIKRHHIDMAAELETQKQEAHLLKMEKQQAEFEAKHDPLTGMINRREFERQLAITLDEVLLHAGRKHVLMFLDLDHFKTVNDTCGHAAGDELLQQVSGLMRHHIREGDLLARMGGDEFAIMLRDCDLSAGSRVADALCTAINNHVYACGGNSFSIGVSIGLSLVSDRSQSLRELIKQADAACYEAKRSGRGRYAVFRVGLSAPVPSL